LFEKVIKDARNKQSMATTVLPLDKEIFGMFYEDWTIKFWQWLCSIPADRNPVLDKGGGNAKVAQFGQPIFNLVPSDGSPKVVRSLTLREGQHILIPVNVVEVSLAEYPLRSETDLHRIASWEFDDACKQRQGLKVNGEDLSKKVHRIPSRVFDIYFPNDPIFGRPGQSKAVSDGYWAIIEPLPKNENTIVIEAGLETKAGKLFYADSVRYNISIK
jgi:hypothetical protein